MGRLSKTKLVLGCCAALAAVPLATPASAGNVVRFETAVAIRETFPAFHGRVRSENDACTVNRKVKLFKRRNGPDKLLGTDLSDDEGRWQVIVDPLSSGAYYAKATRREEGTAGTTFICKADFSRTLIVD